jgi:hypothetical protein
VDQPPYPGGDKAMTERVRFLQAITTRTIAPEVIRKRDTDDAKQVANSNPASAKPQTQGADY